MKKLRRFNPPDLWRTFTIEFRENPDGIRVYGFNERNLKYDKFMGIIYFNSLHSIFCFEPNYKFFHFNTPPLYEKNIEDINRKLNHFWGEHAYLTEEAIDYLMSLSMMDKLTK